MNFNFNLQLPDYYYDFDYDVSFLSVNYLRCHCYDDDYYAYEILLSMMFHLPCVEIQMKIFVMQSCQTSYSNFHHCWVAMAMYRYQIHLWLYLCPIWKNDYPVNIKTINSN